MYFKDDKGNKYNYCWLNGYHYGDRLLEGLYFKFIIENNILKFDQVEKNSIGYAEQINIKMFSDIMIESLKSNEDQGEIFIDKNGNLTKWPGNNNSFEVELVKEDIDPNYIRVSDKMLFEPTYLPYAILEDFVEINTKTATEYNSIIKEVLPTPGSGDDAMYCEKENYINLKYKKDYNEIHWNWINAFFLTHPEFTNIMFINKD